MKQKGYREHTHISRTIIMVSILRTACVRVYIDHAADIVAGTYTPSCSDGKGYGEENDMIE